MQTRGEKRYWAGGGGVTVQKRPVFICFECGCSLKKKFFLILHAHPLTHNFFFFFFFTQTKHEVPSVVDLGTVKKKKTYEF